LRVRLSDVKGMGPTGVVADQPGGDGQPHSEVKGELDDYPVSLISPAINYGDAPPS
jgi:hypothetical protein